MDALIWKALVALAGTGLYLRLVAKEKRRREKHLMLRLIETEKEAEEKARREAENTPTEEGSDAAGPAAEQAA